MGEEVGVDENGVGGDKGGVVLEEERGRDLGDFADDFVAFGFFPGFKFAFVLVLFSGEEFVSMAVAERYGNILYTYSRASRWPIIRLT